MNSRFWYMFHGFLGYQDITVFLINPRRNNLVSTGDLWSLKRSLDIWKSSVNFPNSPNGRFSHHSLKNRSARDSCWKSIHPQSASTVVDLIQHSDDLMTFVWIMGHLEKKNGLHSWVPWSVFIWNNPIKVKLLPRLCRWQNTQNKD